jgi:hypothetical protein
LSAGVITGLPPLPVTLKRLSLVGGAPVPVVIYGERLTGTATYPHAGITDSVAQSVSSGAALSIVPQADGTVPPGRYALTFAGVAIPDFFEVI